MFLGVAGTCRFERQGAEDEAELKWKLRKTIRRRRRNEIHQKTVIEARKFDLRAHNSGNVKITIGKRPESCEMLIFPS